MGYCQHCGKPAGFLKTKHSECAEKNRQGREAMIEEITSSIIKNEKYTVLSAKLDRIAANCYISDSGKIEALILGLNNVVSQFLEDGLLSEEEERRLENFKDHFDLSIAELNANGSWTKLVKAAILRDLFEGKIPQRIEILDRLPFNFQKGETIIWLFQRVKYYEEKTRKEYRGGHQGFSIRIVKGVYYRAGAFRGYPVETSRIVYVDTGLLGITNKHIYFSGSKKSFRVQYNKIVSFTPYDDGIGIHREAASAKPQIFVTGDGWFSYNLISNLGKM